MKKNKGCLVIGAVAIFLFVFAPLCTIMFGGDLLKPGSDFIKISGLSDDESKNIDNILKDCGFTDIESIELDKTLDNTELENEKGYIVESNDIQDTILYLNEDNTVNMVKCGDYELYNQDKVLTKLTDITLTNEEMSNLNIMAQELVKSALKSPSTAKFPKITDWKFAKDKEQIIIQSYVDSQNSFGAMLRSEFQLTLSTKDKSVISFIFDGKEYMK